MRLSVIFSIALLALACSANAYAQNATRPRNPIRISGGASLGTTKNPDTFGSASSILGNIDDYRADNLINSTVGYRYGASFDFYRTRSRTYSVFFVYFDYMHQNYSKSSVGSGFTIGDQGQSVVEAIPEATVSYSALGLGVRSYPFGVKRGKFNLFLGFGAGFYRADSKSYGLVGDDLLQYGKITDTKTRLGGKLFLGQDMSHFFWEAAANYGGSTSSGLPVALNNGSFSLGLRF